jgi:N utilization substance protein A
VPDDQLSLAIGREGQNARLAAKLTGWRVDIKSETEFSEAEEDIEIEGTDDVDGRCAAVLSAGRRCPNASLPGSRYCGLPQHQALARFDTNQVGVLAGLSDVEIGTLADSSADESAVSALVERASAALQAQEAAAEEEVKVEEAEEAVAEEEAAEEADAEAEAEEEAVEEAEAEPAEESEVEAQPEAVEEEPAEEAAEAPDAEPAEAEETEAAETEEVPDAPGDDAEETDGSGSLEPEEALAADAETEGPGA